MIKIAYIFGRGKDIGGGEISSIELAKNINKQEFLPLAILPEEGPLFDYFKKNNIAVKIIRCRGLSFFTALPKAISFLKKEMVDLIHTSAAASKESLVFLLAAKIIKVPYIYHVRVLETNFLEKFLICFSSLSIAISARVKNKVKSAGLKNKITLIYNGVDTYAFRPGLDINYLYGELGLGPDTKIIGIFSRLVEWKGHWFFLEVAKKIKEKVKNIKFIVAGEGKQEYKEKLLNCIQQLNLKNDFLFLGFRSDIPELMNMCDVIVNPSVEDEPFGRTIIEAMSSGCVCVATKGGVEEIIDDGKTGFLVPSLDKEEMAMKIIRVLSDSILKKEIGAAARGAAQEKFDIRIHAQKIENLYLDLLKNFNKA